MDTIRTKIRWTLGYFIRLVLELAKDLWDYCVTPYPFLLTCGALRRFCRRLKITNFLQEFGRQSMRTSPHSPWENPFIERFNLSIKTEVLNRSILKGNDDIRSLCLSYQDFYNSKRPHQGICGAIPDIQDAHTVKSPDIENLKIKKSQVLNGLVTEFRLAA